MNTRNLIPAALAAAALSVFGCQSNPSNTDAGEPAAQPSSNQSRADTDREALAHLVGVWNFRGWSTLNGQHHDASGRAAASIENKYFILMDIQASSGDFAGGATRKSGSFLFASEPGMGLTLTAWGDASPSIRRLMGQSNNSGGELSYKELQPPEDLRRIALTITFQGSDRWTAEVRDSSAAGRPLVASYTFTRQ